MKAVKDFLPKDLHYRLLDYTKDCTYRKIKDDIYNFRGCNIEGELFTEIELLFRKYNLVGEIDKLRVQKIDKSIRMTENFHKHNIKYVENIVCFLNEDFSGGEFEYIDTEIVTILPETNTALVFGPKVRHRVLQVTEGNRYTLVAFLENSSYINKKDTTVI